MNLYDNSTLTILDPQFLVSIEELTPGPELAEVVSEVLAADGWLMLRQGVWTHVHPPEFTPVQQGWKLHVSAGRRFRAAPSTASPATSGWARWGSPCSCSG